MKKKTSICTLWEEKKEEPASKRKSIVYIKWEEGGCEIIMV